MDPLWLLFALIFSFAAKLIRLPPLIGFLVAGFVLHAFGIEGGELIDELAELGVLLLLFTIGLKLRLPNLIAPEVWGGASIHMFISVVLFAIMLATPALMGISWYMDMSWTSAAVIAFALSFSSTIFAVKVLEDRNEIKTRHGQVAIGILIIQDLIAVIFLTLATDKTPTIYAFGLLALPLLRPVIGYMLSRSGHGEVLILFGLFAAIAGSELFYSVGMKGDLGALAFGVLLSTHHKSSELSRSLMGFKDIFLIGFFLSIGINAAPEWLDIIVALALVVVMVPIKTVLFYFLLVQFKLRSRTSFLSALSLANYSEFGLIVAYVGTSSNLIEHRWLVIIAIALSFSFILSSILNRLAHQLYDIVDDDLLRFEKQHRLPGDELPQVGDAEILILGMGRVGSGAYEAMRETHGDKVLGIDADIPKVEEHKELGHNVILGDAEDIDFWDGVNLEKIHLIMLAMPHHEDMLHTVRRLKSLNYKGLISGVAKHEDDRLELKEAGVNAAFNFYAEAGTGFAEHVRQRLESLQANTPNKQDP